MKHYPPSIKKFGQRAILVEWPNEVNLSILNEILEFADCFKGLNYEGWELSVAYHSVTLVNSKGNLDFEATKKQILECCTNVGKSTSKREQFLWQIPVCYDLEFGIDIEEVAQVLEVSVEKLIGLHTSHEYTVFGIGFLPGFMYLGGLPNQLEIPRRKEPRLAVAKGSVGLAGKQTGVYPQESPGGWNIIGNSPTPIFNPSATDPCFVKVGDKIKFKEISKAEYDLKKIEAEVGIYKPHKTRLDA